MKCFFYVFLICPFLGISQTQIGDDINGEYDFDESGFSVAVSSSGDFVAIGAIYNDDGEMNAGHVRVLENQNGIWTRFGEDIDGEYVEENTGYSVSLSSDGSIVAIGAVGSNRGGVLSGRTLVYEYQNGIWVQLGEPIDGEAESDRSGYSVSLSSDGTIIAISSIFNDGGGVSRAGHVRVFEYQTDTWVQLGQDIDGEAAQDLSGTSISISSNGTIIAIGATNNDGNGDSSGHVRVFEYQTDTWVQLGQDIDGEAANDRSGQSVSISSDGTIVAIGASFNDGNGSDSGHVRIFEYQTDTWVQLGQDIDGENTLDESGYSVSLSSDGSVVAIGAFENNGNGLDSGHVRIYQNQNGTWSQIGTDIDGESAQDRASVTALSSNGGVVAIGAFKNIGEDTPLTFKQLNSRRATQRGHVRVYDLETLLSVNEVVASQINIFPNPADSQFEIQVPNGLLIDSITIYNHLGQHIKATKSLLVDTSKLSAGMYFIEIKTSKGNTLKKLIIN